jgi:hypothetical protein
MVLTWLFVPNEAMRVPYLYERFAIFLLPAYAFAFGPASTERAPVSALPVVSGIAALSAAFMVVIGQRAHRFAAEAAPFETVLAAAEPGERALSIILDAASPASRHEWGYHVYPLWYQAEKGGFVDFNFAQFVPEIVRFRAGREPPLTGNVDDKFEWRRLHASMYRYFFVRSERPLPVHLFDNDECQVHLVARDGPWSLFERANCVAPNPI